MFLSPVKAGFPSPADDYLEQPLDLNEHLIKHPAATFFVRVSGDSMIQAGIFNNDILIVDRSLAAVPNRIVVAVVNGEFTVKRLRRRAGRLLLCAENPAYSPLDVTGAADFEVWGVVVYVIHSV